MEVFMNTIGRSLLQGFFVVIIVVAWVSAWSCIQDLSDAKKRGEW